MPVPSPVNPNSVDLESQDETTFKTPQLVNGQIRYRSPSSAELTDPPPSDQSQKTNKRTRQQQQESISDKMYRFRGPILVISVPLLLISLVLLLMPTYSQLSDLRRAFQDNYRYAVIFDAGSSGSRVHVYCFDRNLNLVRIGKELELFVQTKPSLSSYASNPQAAANSLRYLLEQAESVVPKELLGETPVRVGATAGLRQLEGDTSDRILQAVRNFLKDKSELKSEPDWVTVLDGNQEGAFQWVTINYLLGNLGKNYSNTVGVVDLGGGSVQMAYAISQEDAAKAPEFSDGENTYVQELFLRGVKYYLYVHSYLQYGLLAARAEILKVAKGSVNPCILSDYRGTYTYGGETYTASAPVSGSNLDGCREVTLKALKVNESTCSHMKCTFGGIWNGGGGDGQKNLFVASFFFDRAAQAGFIDPDLAVVKVRAVDFEIAAKRACGTNIKDAKSSYPGVEEGDLAYICMDLVYQFTLLVDGFGLDPQQEITLVKQVMYRDALVEAAWPLGSAIQVMSLSSSDKL